MLMGCKFGVGEDAEHESSLKINAVVWSIEEIRVCLAYLEQRWKVFGRYKGHKGVWEFLIHQGAKMELV